MDVDPVKQQEELAQIYFSLSIAVRQFRINNFATIPKENRDLLGQQVEALATRGKECIAGALGAILQSIQPHLPNIKNATQDAGDALTKLNDVAKGLAIASAAVKLVGSIAAGDLGAIEGDLKGLAQATGGQEQAE